MNQESPSALEQSAPPIARPDHATYPPRPVQDKPPKRRSGHLWIWLLVLVALAVGIYLFWVRKPAGTAGGSSSGAAAQKKGFGAIPVVAAKARKGNIPVFYTGLGAVTPIYTVTVQSVVSGQLMDVLYKEGDIVHKGDPLIEIDPRPFQVQLTQAEGQLLRDQALLANAKIDLTRYTTLLAQNAVPEQQLATQQALVTQDEGIVKTDQGMVDSAKLNITYSHIVSPITGRIGLRLVDPGNIVQTSNSSGLLVITQIDPISVIFPIPEDQLPVVQQKLLAGQHLQTEAYDRSSNTKLATGVLSTLDNQIDPTTGTLKLRATFDNKRNTLFANQFVNVRLLVQLKQGVTLIPTATIQRNSQSTYVFFVKPDSTVTVRQITVGTTEGDDSEVTSGLVPGDVIVMTGVDKLQEGTKVSAHFTTAAGTATGKPASNGSSAPGSNPVPTTATTPAASGKSAHKGH
jgi:membrane fusion protein, multidrug efflux system